MILVKEAKRKGQRKVKKKKKKKLSAENVILRETFQSGDFLVFEGELAISYMLMLQW